MYLTDVKTLYTLGDWTMIPMVRTTVRLEVALVASIQAEAQRRDVTVSRLVRDTLLREFGLLRIQESNRRTHRRRQAQARG